MPTPTSPLIPALFSKLPQLLLFLFLLLLSNVPLNSSPHVHCFTRLPVSDEECFCKFSKIFVDVNRLKTSAVSCQPLVKWNGVALCILPVTDTRRYLPILLLLNSNLPVGRVYDGGRG